MYIVYIIMETDGICAPPANEDLTQITLDELLEKAYKYDRQRLSHNEKMKRYRLKYPEAYKARATKLATKRYWRNKGFEINENGEKIRIEQIQENHENQQIPVL